ncbi:hypothetical protein PG997_008783 [Apiospora hydei]|uniref:Uncharacterized protein n=1 Tax=Apiospora hydei TaxID=1337664 RepID=A0ABR1WBT4_9PEZI
MTLARSRRIANANLSSVDVKALVILAQVEALKLNIAQTLESSRGDCTGSDRKMPRILKGNGTEDTMQFLLNEAEEQENAFLGFSEGYDLSGET